MLDSNLAVLLFVGLSGRSNIERNKRLQAFSEADFDLLARIVDASAGLVLSPNILTETSNLIRYMSDPARSQAVGMMTRAIARSRETYVASIDAIRRAEYQRLGLTDAVILELLDGETALLTADLDLYLAATGAKKHAVNFNHIREQERSDFG